MNTTINIDTHLNEKAIESSLPQVYNLNTLTTWPRPLNIQSVIEPAPPRAASDDSVGDPNLLSIIPQTNLPISQSGVLNMPKVYRR